jgi:hypothetical protein
MNYSLAFGPFLLKEISDHLEMVDILDSHSLRTFIRIIAAYLPYFEKIKGSLRDYLAVCVFIYPP